MSKETWLGTHEWNLTVWWTNYRLRIIENWLLKIMGDNTQPIEVTDWEAIIIWTNENTIKLKWSNCDIEINKWHVLWNKKILIKRNENVLATQSWTIICIENLWLIEIHDSWIVSIMDSKIRIFMEKWNKIRISDYNTDEQIDDLSENDDTQKIDSTYPKEDNTIILESHSLKWCYKINSKTKTLLFNHKDKITKDSSLILWKYAIKESRIWNIEITINWQTILISNNRIEIINKTKFKY